MGVSQLDKARAFKALHQGRTFVIPNPWDIGSARVLAGLGFKALATSSAASACALGLKDGEMTRAQALDHARDIVGATSLPVSADLERGFGDTPDVVAETIRLAADAGLVGCTIEDTTGTPGAPLYDDGLAVERIAAAVDAANALPFPFMLTARAHNLMFANASLDATIRRLEAFERVGAHVLFAPGLPDLDAVRTLCASVTAPVNFMAGIKGKSFSVAELAGCGVRRISLATSLYRAAMGGFIAAARQVRDDGRLGFIDDLPSTGDVLGLMGD